MSADDADARRYDRARAPVGRDLRASEDGPALSGTGESTGAGGRQSRGSGGRRAATRNQGLSTPRRSLLSQFRGELAAPHQLAGSWPAKQAMSSSLASPAKCARFTAGRPRQASSSRRAVGQQELPSASAARRPGRAHGSTVDSASAPSARPTLKGSGYLMEASWKGGCTRGWSSRPIHRPSMNSPIHSWSGGSACRRLRPLPAEELATSAVACPPTTAEAVTTKRAKLQRPF